MSAFGYFGSKMKLSGKLLENLPPHNAWVELFCGSAAMTLAKKPAPIEVINDIHGEIVNFFKQLRENGNQLIQQIILTPYSRAEFIASREKSTTLTEIERARRFYISAMMSINGSFGTSPGGFSLSNSYSRNGMEARVSRWNNMPEYLESIIERLKTVRIEHKDAISLFRDFQKRPATLVYLDPPYLADRIEGYDHEQLSSDFHEELLGVATKAKCMVFISGYDSDLYNDILTPKTGWSKKVVAASTKGTTGESFSRKEVVWFNQVYTNASSSGRISLRLSAKESKNKKVNPER